MAIAQNRGLADHRVNDRIRAPKVRLIGADGSQVGVFRVEEALNRAREADLDLVEVAPQADPPVCRIMDYGKFKYEQSLRQKEARKKQGSATVKEMKFRPKIDPHDYDTKKRKVEDFLQHGHRVKVTVMFRGREMFHTELGHKILQRLTTDLEEIATAETTARLDGRNMTMMFAPSRRRPPKEKDQKESRDGRREPSGGAAADDGQTE